MALSSRWYLSRRVRESTIPGTRVPRGFTSAVVAELGGDSEGGLYIGHLPVPALGLVLNSVTVDLDVVSGARALEIRNTLRDADDSVVFDVRSAMDESSSTWARLALFRAFASSRLLDVEPGGRIDAAATSGSIRSVFQEVARTMTLFASLAHTFVPIDLDAPLSSVPVIARAAMADTLLEIGFAPTSLPAPSSTLRAAVRALLEDPRAEFGIDSGRFVVGHPVGGNLATSTE